MLHTRLKFPLLFLLLIASSYCPISPLSSDITVLTLHGKASWYGPYFHGRQTANGEIFNKNDLTAAHKTLPFNTKVLVTNLKNNKSVIVRINDRGPFIEGRIIDLSEEAACRINSKIEGIALVTIQVLSHNTITSN